MVEIKKDREINHEEEILELFQSPLDTKEFHNLIMEYHPYDIARVFEKLNADQRSKLYIALSPQEIAPIFEHLDHQEIPRIFTELSNNYSVKILENMDIDETVDILRNIENEKLRLSYIGLMSRELAKEIKALLKYDEDVTGSIMSTSYIEFDDSMLIKDAMKHMLKEAKTVSYINTLYVSNKSDELVGVLSLRQLIVAGKEDRLVDVMTEKVISVDVNAPKEVAASLFKDYDFEALPVVDSNNRMLGIVTVDDIIDFLEDEATEDYAKFAGIFDGEIDHGKETISKAFRKRIPWLIILLFIGIIASMIIGRFEETLDAIPILAMFLPMMLDMAGNVGTQSLAVTIRYLMDEDFLTHKNVSKHILRELGIGVTNGFIVSCIAFFISFTLLGIMKTNVSFFNLETLKTSVIISFSMFVSIIVSNIAGAIVPLIIHTFKIDPAAASGPFITTINDIIAISVYFTLATIFLM